ncbi:MAG: PP2C family protein-serine/threonine phosphatase [Isosphaeraceae bacterium]
MLNQWEPQTPPRLAGYESWLYQMPCMYSGGDVFVSMPLPGHSELSIESPTHWLVAVGDVSGRGEAATRLKESLEAKVTQLVGTTTDPAAVLEALNNDPVEPDSFACLLVAVIDSDGHELTLASAGHIAPFLRHTDRRIVSLGEQSIGVPLWIVPTPHYDNVVFCETLAALDEFAGNKRHGESYPPPTYSSASSTSSPVKIPTTWGAKISG